MVKVRGLARLEPFLKVDNRWLAVVVGLATLIGSSLLGSAISEQMAGDKKSELRRQLEYVARNAAQFVDGDHHNAIRKRGSMDGDYDRANERLRKILVANEDIQFVYTCYFEDGKVRFGLDPTAPGDHDGDGREDQAKLGEEYPEASRPMLKALRTGTVQVDSEPYSDDWGSFISGYAPVLNSHGELEAVVGVDLTARGYESELAGVEIFRKAWMAGSFAAALLVGCVALWVLSRFHTRFLRVVESKDALEAAFADLADLNLRLDHQNRTDSLTSLLNRKGSLEAIRETMRSNPDHDIALALMDLDRFKVANDHFGHTYGDQYLIAFAECLSQFVQGALIGRLGGDEFIVCMGGPDALDRLTDSLSAFQAKLAEEVLFVGLVAQSTTVSIGLSSGKVPDEPGELIRQADIAMYEAKRYGVGQLRVYEPSMGKELERRVELERELRSGWDESEFWMAIQPIVDLNDGSAVAGELLMRWTRADGTTVPPSEFIPAIEESGMIHEIGLWAIEEACRQVERLERELPGQRIHLSVNVSPKQLNRAKFVEQVEDVLGHYTFHKGAIWFEITESALISEGPEAIEHVRTIREMGVKIALDDFGTGYSSLSMIAKMPLDCLKIDRSFVNGIEEDRDTAALVQTIFNLSELLGLHVVAEGIENAEQGRLLRSMCGQWGQGYFYAKPMPIDEFIEFCRNRRMAA